MAEKETGKPGTPPNPAPKRPDQNKPLNLPDETMHIRSV